jgi:signal peptidase II
MFKIDYKKLLLNSIITLVIFLIDRVTKFYILKIVETESLVDIYINPYLNFYLIWNKGIAFGLLSFNKNLIYDFLTLVIFVISIIIISLIIKTNGLKRYALIFVLGGAFGNLYDRVYYSAVPDFIDFHIGGIHWFVFNVADIFITLGVICLILVELFDKKKHETN